MSRASGMFGCGGWDVATAGASDTRLWPGSSLGRYVVEFRLARGGMGEIWRARALGPCGFQKRVVIKTVLPELMRKPAYVQMLVREASLAARLDHPNIVHVFDLGCVGGLYYIAMEYLSGRTLAQMLRRSQHMGRRLPLRVLLSVIAACCDGLQYAHDYIDDDGRPLGLLHRDISPSNIMVTFAGRIALLDFGVATAARGRYRTKASTLKGKVHYLSPERVRGEPHDRRSDIYSLGVVLYHGLTLRWPFRAPGEYELLRQIAHGTAPPVRHHAPWIAPRLEQIVMRAMACDRASRYHQAVDLAADLRDYLRATGAVITDPNELAGCLTDLFPEGPKGASGSRPAGAADAGEDDLDLLPPSSGWLDTAATGEASLDPSAPVAPPGGAMPSPVTRETVVGRIVPPSLPPLSARRQRATARRAATAVDIFPEARRTAAPAGHDLFSGCGRRRAPSSGGDEPAFSGARAEAPAGGAWAWALPAPGEGRPGEQLEERGEPEGTGRRGAEQDSQDSGDVT